MNPTFYDTLARSNLQTEMCVCDCVRVCVLCLAQRKWITYAFLGHMEMDYVFLLVDAL